VEFCSTFGLGNAMRPASSRAAKAACSVPHEGHNGSTLSDKPMSQPGAWRMIRRRAVAAGIAAEIGWHKFRATGIIAYLANGGALKHAQGKAAHESPANDETL
jgi:hypothetical protein